MSIVPIAEDLEGGFEIQSPRPADAWDGGWPQSPERFEALVEAYLDRLVRYAFRRLGDFHDAEDVVQEVFVRAFADRSKRKNIHAVGAYLYRMTANACSDFQRRPSLVEVSLEEIGSERIPGSGKSPSEAAEAAEERQRAEELLRRLPPKQAEAIRLRVFDELRLNEIAEVLGCSMHTVNSRLRYGFRKLRKIVSGKRG